MHVIVIVIGLIVVASLALVVAIGRMFRKAAPNQAIIVYGFRKPRVIKSGAAVIFPRGGDVSRAHARIDEL